MSSYVTQLRSLVSRSIRSSSKVSIVVTRKKPTKTTKDRLEYTNFTTQINNAVLELSNEIVSDLESCSYDYPDRYVSLSVVSLEGHELFHLIHEPEA
jgi:hypothetical protein